MLTMKDIIDDHNKTLREVSKNVSLPLSEEDKNLLLEMHEFLVNSQEPETCEKYDLRPGVGIAAVQLGIPKRMCAIHILDYDNNGNVTNANDYALVNPTIVSHTEKKSYLRDGEGCLSVNDEIQGYVPRYAKVTVKGYDLLTDQEVTIVARGFMAICLQHELDHFEGTLFYDRINKDNPFAPIKNAMVIE